MLQGQLELTLTRSFAPLDPSTKQSKQAAKSFPPPSSPTPTGGATMDDAAPPSQTASTGVETGNPNAGMSQDACVKAIHKSLKHPTVRFLREHMEKAGCPVWARILMAGTCKDQTSAGGYAHRYGVTVCCNHMSLQDEVNQVIIHELIHAYDDCRAKNMDWKNCAHHACSEIRANHLSGDCHYKRELLRGFMKIRGHEQECVKRRALKSVMKNPHCSEAASKDAIEAVWDICYNDTYPFDRAP